MKVLILVPMEHLPLAQPVIRACREASISMEISANIENVESEVARTGPDGCVLILPVHCDEARDLVQRYAKQFPTVYFRVLRIRENGELEESWEDNLQPLFDHVVKLPEHLSIAENRQIHYAPEFSQFTTGEKLNRPSHGPGWEAALTLEMQKLQSLLQGAQCNHSRARHYHRLLCETVGEELQEACYRVLHGSFKGWFYTREELARWLAVVAHYMPGIEVSHLPPPGDVGAAHRYIHYYPTDEAHYALASATLYAHEALHECMKEVLDCRWTGKVDGCNLLWLSNCLRGWCDYAREIAHAHIRLFDWWLKTEVSLDDIVRAPRSQRRNMQILCEYWKLPHLRETPQALAATIQIFHEGVRCEPFAQMNSFAQFQQLLIKSNVQE